MKSKKQRDEFSETLREAARKERRGEPLTEKEHRVLSELAKAGRKFLEEEGEESEEELHKRSLEYIRRVRRRRVGICIGAVILVTLVVILLTKTWG